jgi:hypothetical protein
MPVGVDKVGGKYRVTEKGRVAKNKKGHPIDGGGFNTREQALRQQRAINRSLMRS